MLRGVAQSLGAVGIVTLCACGVDKNGLLVVDGGIGKLSGVDAEPPETGSGEGKRSSPGGAEGRGGHDAAGGAADASDESSAPPKDAQTAQSDGSVVSTTMTSNDAAV